MTHTESRASTGSTCVFKLLWVIAKKTMTHAESRASIGFRPFVGQSPIKFTRVTKICIYIKEYVTRGRGEFCQNRRISAGTPNFDGALTHKGAKPAWIKALRVGQSGFENDPHVTHT